MPADTGCHHSLRGTLLSLAIALTLTALCVLAVACGGDDADDFTPPPATIIRASDTMEPTAPMQQVSEPTETRPLPPTRPPVTPVSATERDYPIPQGSPVATSTPMAYPTK